MTIYTTPISLTGNKDIDFLIYGLNKLEPSEGTNTYTWGFSNFGRAATADLHGDITSDSSKGYMRYATQQMSNIANVNFKEIDSSTGLSKDILVYSPAQNASYEGIAVSNDGAKYAELEYKNWVDGSPVPNWNTAGHELAHVMGLSHPHKLVDGQWVDDPRRPEFNRIDTVMSYNTGLEDPYDKNGPRLIVRDAKGDFLSYAYTKTYGIYDIQALQYIYGANYDYNSKDTVYSYNPETLNFFETIWDGGGNDTIDVSAFKNGSDINLNGGTRSSVYLELTEKQEGMNAYNGKDAIGIAYGANIENANGTQGNDIIYGNELNNVINGNKGNDTLYGGAGNDTLNGGDGDDILYGDEGDDVLSGGSGNNILYGGAGNDTLISTGNDKLYGGDGNDRYEIWGPELPVIIEGVNGGHDRIDFNVMKAISYIMPDNVEDISLNTMLDYNINIEGNSLNNFINGNFGNNILVGGKGNDVLQGYKGSDTYIFNKGDGQDTIWEYNNKSVPVTDTDVLVFTDISVDQLWFTKSTSWGSESLTIKVLGTTDQVKVEGWYTNNAKLEQIKTQDGVTLSINQVESLADIMANQTMPTASNSSIIDDYLAHASMMVA
ncbi:hypothetical protein EKN56_02600 [Limnobaculum zhutongyuii]|uniref:Haemolysin-type calcium binding-related domain-containing protein n=1 Tax=Limnobaculum zhutongyuii TaxID=2498113 RepID=A0A411WGQ2_9GAMM|nr:calcium-binding protein [Limnobaculum zhutongyuii]QBH95389.1 hypothetical protein EKN56_02600 [Limnobaculum zhutongyuii]TQS88993.1 hypothetical protein ELQ32_07300 [Limnobaculum zhutongyuii]